MMDPELLDELDATPEVQREGRSAVLRRAVSEYLARRQRMLIREQYQHAYGGSGGAGEEWSGWEEEGVWPAE